MVAIKQPDYITVTIKRHFGTDAIIPLREIDASLPMADLNERVELKS